MELKRVHWHSRRIGIAVMVALLVVTPNGGTVLKMDAVFWNAQQVLLWMCLPLISLRRAIVHRVTYVVEALAIRDWRQTKLFTIWPSGRTSVIPWMRLGSTGHDVLSFVSVKFGSSLMNPFLGYCDAPWTQQHISEGLIFYLLRCEKKNPVLTGYGLVIGHQLPEQKLWFLRKRHKLNFLLRGFMIWYSLSTENRSFHWKYCRTRL
jgi:hypothetical protein